MGAAPLGFAPPLPARKTAGMAKDAISYEDAFGPTSTPAAPSTGSISYEEAFCLPSAPPKRRTLASIANDTVIEVANAAAGGMSAAGNFVRPGNAVSGWIDKNIVEAGKASQSDATEAEMQRFLQGVTKADGVMDDWGRWAATWSTTPYLLQLRQQALSSTLPWQ